MSLVGLRPPFRVKKRPCESACLCCPYKSTMISMPGPPYRTSRAKFLYSLLTPFVFLLYIACTRYQSIRRSKQRNTEVTEVVSHGAHIHVDAGSIPAGH